MDSKRGDIARSSLNYAIEAFDCWNADAVTISPYMGSDSILPFISEKYLKKGAYILNRTSNPGASDIQNLCVSNSKTIYENVAKQIREYAAKYPCTGAVVGATCMQELEIIASIYSLNESTNQNKKDLIDVPMLIPGVGSQGGSASDVITTLKKTGYDLRLVRINSSSGLTHPWKKIHIQKTI